MTSSVFATKNYNLYMKNKEKERVKERERVDSPQKQVLDSTKILTCKMWSWRRWGPSHQAPERTCDRSHSEGPLCLDGRLRGTAAVLAAGLAQWCLLVLSPVWNKSSHFGNSDMPYKTGRPVGPATKSEYERRRGGGGGNKFTAETFVEDRSAS